MCDELEGQTLEVDVLVVKDETPDGVVVVKTGYMDDSGITEVYSMSSSPTSSSDSSKSLATVGREWKEGIYEEAGFECYSLEQKELEKIRNKVTYNISLDIGVPDPRIELVN